MSPSKREAILTGMLECVGRQGYEGTSVRCVLDRTGLYRQAFYDEFADKGSCFLAALDAEVEALEASMREAASAEGTWRGELRAGLGRLLDSLDARPAIGRALFVEVHAAGPGALRRRGEAMGRAARFVERARVETDAAAPPPIAPEGVVAGIHAVIHARLSAGPEAPFAALLPEFVYFAVLPYFGPETAAEEMRATREGG